MKAPANTTQGKKRRFTVFCFLFMAAVSAIVHFMDFFMPEPSNPYKLACAIILFCTLILGVIVAVSLLMALNASGKAIEEQSQMIDRIKDESQVSLSEANAKADFLVNMSHEIRTPMNAICCATELLMKEEHSETAGSYLSILKSSSENLLDVVNDILDFSKIDAGKMNLTEEEYSIETLLDDVKNIISVRLADKPVAFVVDVDPTLPKTIIGDEVRIRQILINLLGNSVKFTAKGLISLTVSYERLSKESIDISFAVRDTGVGIANSDKEKIFQKFGQAGVIKKTPSGTGLGLTICRELATMMGGSISFTSELGKGSVFTARLRQRVTPDNAPIVDVEKNKNLALDFLIWDDNIHYADSLENILKKMGLSVRRVFRESEAEGVLSTVKIDFFIVCSNMFKAAADILARISPATVPVKLLDIGEVDQRDHREKYPVLRKPFDVFGILEILKSSKDREKFTTDRDSKFVTPDANILIVDDNRVNLKVARALLETFRAKIVDVDSGAEAIDIVAGGAKFDIIFMDHMMPGMDGIEAAKRIWELEGENKTPIIALSANTGGEIEKLFFEAGMSDFLSKPIVMKHLSYVMQKWLPKEKIVYIKDESKLALKKRERKGEVVFKPEDGLNELWGDEEIFSRVLRIYYDQTGAMVDQITESEPADAKPVIEQLSNMSRAAGARHLSGLLSELWSVADMGKTDVYNGILKAVCEEHKMILAEIGKRISADENADESDILGI